MEFVFCSCHFFLKSTSLPSRPLELRAPRAPRAAGLSGLLAPSLYFSSPNLAFIGFIPIEPMPSELSPPKEVLINKFTQSGQW